MKTKTHREKRPIILVGGGTGGHITPLIAVGEELNARHQPFIYIGGRNSREQAIITQLGWPLKTIEVGKWRRENSVSAWLANATDVIRIITGFFQAIKIILASGAPRIFSKGGPVALPVVYASKVLGRPVVIHESDAVMGNSNRLASRLATRVLTAFEPKNFPHSDSRWLQVGIPIRQSLRQAATLKAPQKTRPLILVMGGIQGSSAINGFVRANLTKLIEEADVIHSTGEREFALHQQASNQLAQQQKNLSLQKRQKLGSYKPFAFIDRELPYYFRSADLIISRASATTIAEAALFGQAMYLVPLPSSANNHQLVNAQKLAEARAVAFDQQSQLTNEKFLARVTELLHDQPKRVELGQKLHQYFNEERSLTLIMETLGLENHGSN
jgi:UDP-N-acetylglucosamine--N-acetylmuramyl-(pentapeptide) pyrophosphoryl-undecaprenol N-acetylglucosamine transferase